MDEVKKNHIKIKRMTFLAMMFACMLVLTAFEYSLPPIPLFPPNMKLGLSNVIVMYCLFFTGKKDAFVLTILKSFFVFLLKGPIAAGLSVAGGLCALVVMVGLIFLYKEDISYTMVSIWGAVAHNAGQLAVFSLMMQSGFVFYYFPVLLIAGIVMGGMTGILVKAVLPVFRRAMLE